MRCKLAAMKSAPRPYHHGNLRQELLRAAEAALEARGIQQLSLRELSRELGVSHASPQRHFATKQELIDALAIVGFERLGSAMARAAEPPPPGFQHAFDESGARLRRIRPQTSGAARA
jgi:AcrR family transcriptional regulator